MSQPVRVSLVFPRSGQQVFVNVPPHIAEYVDSRRTDHKPHHSQALTSSAGSRNCVPRETDLNQQ